MSWKKLPSWIKGGIIGGVVAFLVSLVLLPFGLTEGHPTVLVSSLITYYLLLIFGETIAEFVIIMPILINNLILFYIIQIFINITVYFILGSLIGFLFSKRKYLKRKEYLTGAIIGFIFWLILMYIRIIFNIANDDFTGLLAFISYILIGALIGWIYGKIKGNKK